MPFSLKNILDEAVQIINFMDSQPLSVHLFNILCGKMGMLLKLFCCLPKYSGRLKETHWWDV